METFEEWKNDNHNTLLTLYYEITNYLTSRYGKSSGKTQNRSLNVNWQNSETFTDFCTLVYETS